MLGCRGGVAWVVRFVSRKYLLPGFPCDGAALCKQRHLSPEELAVAGEDCSLPDLIVESIVGKQRQ